jgi:Kyakuja-Dileera-Zisupton transposase
MFKTWLFYSSFCSRFSKGRKVCFIILSYYLLSSEAFYRHVNIDYSICHALSYRTEGMTEALVSYDIACQWNKNFSKRVDESPFLNLPESLSIIPGVGKMHLGAHIPKCFAFYSLNFISGAGQQDGEIIETLWSSLNKVSGSIRAMSKAHRHEVLDDHMRDSNWKKLIGMGMILLFFYLDNY